MSAAPAIVARRPIPYIAALAAVIAIGLASRTSVALVPFLGKEPGDALWALAVFLGWGLLMPRASTWRIAAYALVTSYVDEVSQLIHTSWLDAARATLLGHLVLGSGFSWSDMAAYTAGAAIGVLIERRAFGANVQCSGRA